MAGTNDLIIPEMQRVKEKYPVYKDMPDVGLLNTIVRKYPVYKPIADRVAGEISGQRQEQVQMEQEHAPNPNGEITSAPITLRSEARRIMRNLELGSQGDQDQIPLVLGKQGTAVRAAQDIARVGVNLATPVAEATAEVGKTLFERPVGAVKALVSGKSPIEGWKKPEEQESFGESFVKATGADLNNPAVFATAIAYDIVANLGTMHLFYNVPPKLTGEVKKTLVTAYTGAQGKALKELRAQVIGEFKIAGMTDKVASDAADQFIWAGFQENGFLQKTPFAINQTTVSFKANKGVFGKQIKDMVATAREEAAKKGFTDDFMRKMREASPSLTDQAPLGGYVRGLPAPKGVIYGQAPVPQMLLNDLRPEPQPTTGFGILIRDQLLKKYDIPLHPKDAAILEKSKIYQNDVLSVMQSPDRIPKTDFGRQIKERILAKEQVPLHPASEGRLELAKIINQPAIATPAQVVSSKIETTSMPGKEYKTKVKYTSVDDSKEKYVPESVVPKALQTKAEIVVTKAGGKLKGVVGGEDSIYENDATVYYNTPSGSTQTIRASELSIDAVKKKIAAFESVKAKKGQVQTELFEQHPITKVSIPPVKAEELQARPQIADEVLQRPANQTPEVRAAAKQVQSQPTPEIVKPQASREDRLQKIKETAAERQLRQRVAQDYTMDSFYDVTFRDETGVHSTLVDGEELLLLEKRGQVVSKRKWNNRGSLDLQWMYDLANDFVGEKEKFVVSASQAAKSLGAPFMVGEKYPPFKAVHMAVSDAIDRKNEMFTAGAHRLQPKFQRSLSTTSKEKLTDVVKLGNSPGVEKYYTPEELVAQFGFNEKEVEAYMRLKRTYDLATNMEIQSRKLGAGYEDMTPEEKVQFDQRVREQVMKRGGFVTQQRLQGDWMVYAPPAEGEEIASFFNLYERRSDALKAQEALGPGAMLGLRTKIEQQMYRHLSLSDLESLIEAADVSSQSTDVAALRKVLQERSFASHWIKRKNVPGYEWNWDNITASAIDYLEGAANKLSRIEGRINSTKAFRENVGKMSPGLSAYTQKFIDGYYNTGAIGFRGFGAFMHFNNLALKPSFLAQNLTQSLSTTWPEMSQYFSGVELEAAFADASAKTLKYIGYLLKGEAHGLDSETFGYLEKLRRQGYLGDQIAKFELQVRHPIMTTFDRATTLFGRMTEPPNRIIAGLVARTAAMNKLRLLDKNAIFEFGKNKISKTQFRYDKANLPTLITGAGNMKNLLRAAYTFRSFSVNYLQLLAGMMPWRGAGAKQYTRAIGSILLQSGIKGIPFFGLGALAYKQMMGRTLDNDIREAMEETGIPDKAIDATLHGAYSFTGVDASGLIGLGDIAGYNGGVFERLGGAPIGQIERYQKAIGYMQQGDPRWIEEASPAVMRNLLKGMRYAKEGMRTASGELVLNPSKQDAILTAHGFTPMAVSKAYDAEEAKNTIKTSGSDKLSGYHQKIARLMDEGKRQEAYGELRKAQKEGLKITPQSIKTWRLKRRGIDKSTPRKLRREFGEIDERYGKE